MGSRILKQSICTSDTIDALSAEEERFFYRLIVNADDHGRLDGRLTILRAACFPLHTEIPLETIGAWMQTLVTVGLVTPYTVENRDYFVLTSWEQHQQVRTRRSRFPAPSNNGSGDPDLISNDIKRLPDPIQYESESKTERAHVPAHETGWNEAIPPSLHEPLAILERLEQSAHPERPWVLSEPQQIRLVQLVHQGMAWEAVQFVLADCAAQGKTWSYAMGKLAGMFRDGKKTVEAVMGLAADRASPRNRGRPGPPVRTLAELRAGGEFP